MKNILLPVGILMLAAMLLLPLLATSPAQKPPDSGVSSPSGQAGTLTKSVGYFMVKNPADGTISKVSDDDYVFGVVAGEMEPSSNKEALKAQAVVAYTYAARKRQARAQSGTGDYDLTATHVNDQEYLTGEQIRAKWGEQYDTYSQKLTAVVAAIKGYVITYEQEPILAVCHAISGGKTETAANVWGQDYPYLQAVDSVGDLMAAGYASKKTYTPEEMKAALAALDVTVSGEPDTWFSLPENSGSGTVLNVKVGDKTLTGRQIREGLSLRSGNFTVLYEAGTFVLDVYGYGHGVGMSQSGAQAMALEGSSFVEILSWYFPGCAMLREKL